MQMNDLKEVKELLATIENVVFYYKSFYSNQLPSLFFKVHEHDNF